MWPFTRKTDASKAAGQPAPTLPQIRFEWKAVPAIQRVVADHPLTAPTEAFASGLVTHQDPRAVAEPLGHQVSLEAPPGLVLGIVQPRTRADGPEMPTHTRASRRLTAQRAPDESTEAHAVNEDPEIAAPTIGDGPAVSAIRQLPVSSAAPLQRAPLTVVGPDNEPRPLPPTRDIVTAGGEAVGEPEAIVPVASLPTSPRLTLGQARRLGLGAPLSRVPDTAVQRAADQAPPPPAISSPAAPASEEQPYSPIFPLDFPTPKPVVAPAPISRPQRIPATLPLARPPVSTEAETPAEDAAEAGPVMPAPITASDPGRSPAAEPEMVAPLIGPPAVAASSDLRSTVLEDPAEGEWEGSDAAPQPPLSLAGNARTMMRTSESEGTRSPTVPTGGNDIFAAAETGSEPVADGSNASAPLGGALPRIAPLGAASPRIAPLLSERPGVMATVQRAPEGVRPSGGSALTDAMPGGLGGIRIHRGSNAATKATALGARAFTQGDDIFLPTAHGPMDAPPARSLLAHELVHVGQQRRLGSAVPAEESDDGRLMEAEAQVVERSVASGVELPLARTPMPSVVVGTDRPLARIAAPSVQASTTVLEAYAPWVTPATIQRAPDSDSPGPTSSEPPLTASGAEQPAAADATSPQDDDMHMDDLAAKLYDKIRSRLRNELLVDRERAGFLTDLR